MPAGPQGEKGPAGERGPPGPAAQAMNITVRNVPGQLVSLSGIAHSIATCDPDELVTGGGFSITNGPGIVLSSTPQGDSWIVSAAIYSMEINPRKNSHKKNVTKRNNQSGRNNKMYKNNGA